MIRKLLGSKIPKAELERMLPELKQKMFSSMPDFLEDEEEEEFEPDLDFIFGSLPPKSKKKKGRTRGGFQELF
jgi:hypothetical protein